MDTVRIPVHVKPPFCAHPHTGALIISILMEGQDMVSVRGLRSTCPSRHRPALWLPAVEFEHNAFSHPPILPILPILPRPPSSSPILPHPTSLHSTVPMGQHPRHRKDYTPRRWNLPPQRWFRVCAR
jgi:hypothetical protein